MLSYLCICIARYRACVHSRYVRYVYHPSGAGPYLPLAELPVFMCRYVLVLSDYYR
jgi:hypothetical protein